MQIKTKSVLYVENVRMELEYFTNYKGDFQNRAGYCINLDTARTIDEARRKIHDKKFDALLLDMMLPENEKRLQELDILEEKRELLWIRYNDISGNSMNYDVHRAELKKIRDEISRIDLDIEKTLRLQGGLEIAQYYIEKYGKMPVIFFTAIGDPTLSEKCLQVIGEKLLWYLEKPATVEEVYTQFVKMWDN